jgi:hypothetical protein
MMPDAVIFKKFLPIPAIVILLILLLLLLLLLSFIVGIALGSLGFGPGLRAPGGRIAPGFGPGLRFSPGGSFCFAALCGAVTFSTSIIRLLLLTPLI